MRSSYGKSSSTWTREPSSAAAPSTGPGASPPPPGSSSWPTKPASPPSPFSPATASASSTVASSPSTTGPPPTTSSTPSPGLTRTSISRPLATASSSSPSLNVRLSPLAPSPCATRPRVSMPTSGFHRGTSKTLAMYPHRPTGQYRLLLQRRSFMGSPKDQSCCYIFALGSGQPPRCIAWLEMLMAYLDVPVRVHDSLHWYPKFYPSDSKRVIIVFDTVAESFRTMRAPIVPPNSYIFEMDGTLGICSQSNATEYVDIWVLQNYETEVWELKYRIELPVAEIREKFEGCDWNVDVVSADGGVLLLVSGYR